MTKGKLDQRKNTEKKSEFIRQYLRNINWKALLIIGVPSGGLGYFIDELLGWNNYSFLISGLLPAILISLYRSEIAPLGIKCNHSINESFINNFLRHKIFTFIFYLFITRIIFGTIALVFGIDLTDIKIDNKLYISITLTTILVTIFGDCILLSLFKSAHLLKALFNKEYFFNQDSLKIFIYSTYLILLFVTNCGIWSKSVQLWVNTFATYIAFERVWNKFNPADNKKA